MRKTYFRRRHSERILFYPRERLLFHQLRRQKKIFYALKEDFIRGYRRIYNGGNSAFMTEAWISVERELEAVLLPFPPFHFLRLKSIAKRMYMDASEDIMDQELMLLRKIFLASELKTLVSEDYAGAPVIRDLSFTTSHNAVHQLYHLAIFKEYSGIDLMRCKHIVEWGAGYGCLAKLVKRINPSCTYSTIDIPLLCMLQFLYLATVCGKENVVLHTDPTMQVIAGKINIIPVGYLISKNVNADLFCALWSLSESSRAAQEYVRSKKYFSADHVLAAFQTTSDRFPDASHMGNDITSMGGSIHKSTIFPDNYYALL